MPVGFLPVEQKLEYIHHEMSGAGPKTPVQFFLLLFGCSSSNLLHIYPDSYLVRVVHGLRLNEVSKNSMLGCSKP